MAMLKRILTGLLIVGLVLIPLTIQVPVEAKTTKQKLAEIAHQQDLIDDKLAVLDKQQAQLADQRSELTGDLAWLNQRSAQQKAIYIAKSEQLKAAMDELDQAYDDYLQAQATLEAKQNQYIARLKVMYEHRNQSMMKMILESRSLQSFFTVIQFMAIIEETDQQMIDDLQNLTDDAALKRQQADEKSAELQGVVEQLEADLARLKADASATEANLARINARLSAQQEAEDALESESQRLGQDIYALQRKLAAERAATATATAQRNRDKQDDTPAPVIRNGWTWPVPGHKSITSKYGNRLHPVYKVYKFHSGIDIAAPFGSSVVAARSGTVIMVVNPVQGQNTGGSGYGNYIVVDHGDGYSTLYAHLKRTLVSKNQTVGAGTRIALVGSTGTSTGAHLHFEVRLNGDTVNPANYVH